MQRHEGAGPADERARVGLRRGSVPAQADDGHEREHADADHTLGASVEAGSNPPWIEADVRFSRRPCGRAGSPQLAATTSTRHALRSTTWDVGPIG